MNAENVEKARVERVAALADAKTTSKKLNNAVKDSEIRVTKLVAKIAATAAGDAKVALEAELVTLNATVDAQKQS